MPPEAEFALLRTAQEALANVARHARATRVGVTLSYMEDQVALDVRDDGQGFDLKKLCAQAAGAGPANTSPANTSPANTSPANTSPANTNGSSHVHHINGLIGLSVGDGLRRDPASTSDGGFGLVAMRQRIESLAGTLQVESEPGFGTGVSACLPVAAGTEARS
jgi:signal transduction histidine kinase